MEFDLSRAWDMLIGRIHGPLAFRIIVQPLVAAFLATRAGFRDARSGRPPHGWAMVVDPTRRGALSTESWQDVSRLFAAAIVVDAIYQIIVFHWIYVGQTLIVAIILALPAYLLIRGLANRVARLWLPRTGGPYATGATGFKAGNNRHEGSC